MSSEQPLPPPPPAPKYQVVETYPQGKWIQLNKQPTNLWGMNYDFNFMKDHPVEVHEVGEKWLVTNKVHHIDGYNYYRRDGQVDGFNVADCDDYTPPPAPYVPPAAPIAYPEAEKYVVTNDTVMFNKAVDAKNDQNATGTVKAGTYYVYSSDLGMKNLTDNASKNQNQWVNPNQKLPEMPVVTPPTLPVDPPPVHDEPVDMGQTVVTPTWKAPVTHSMKPDGSPVYFHALNQVEVDIPDLQTGDTIPMPAYNDGKLVPITQWLEYNGVVYYRPQKVAKAGWWNCIREDLLQQADDPRALDINHDGKVNLDDIGYVIQDYIVTPAKRAIYTAHELGLLDKAVNVTTKIQKQVIDGFSSRRKR